MRASGSRSRRLKSISGKLRRRNDELTARLWCLFALSVCDEERAASAVRSFLLALRRYVAVGTHLCLDPDAKRCAPFAADLDDGSHFLADRLARFGRHFGELAAGVLAPQSPQSFFDAVETLRMDGRVTFAFFCQTIYHDRLWRAGRLHPLRAECLHRRMGVYSIGGSAGDFRLVSLVHRRQRDCSLGPQSGDVCLDDRLCLCSV